MKHETEGTKLPAKAREAETLEGLMTRDLAAWREAKALIDRAKRS